MDDVPGDLGPRLKRIRQQRRITLTALAETTGISKSTLSRLETGQRRPTLELLLALSKAYRVPLDDLVAAPEVGDPRVQLKPGQVKGRTVIPLTRQPEGMQAWKIVIPTSKTKPEPRSHDGHEWIYVLSGHMRLVLGDQDWVLGPGSVRHPGAALVRQHRRPPRRNPQHLRPARRADEDPDTTSARVKSAATRSTGRVS
jgi:transcriptional regulator with XRE-family HTH domain